MKKQYNALDDLEMMIDDMSYNMNFNDKWLDGYLDEDDYKNYDEALKLVISLATSLKSIPFKEIHTIFKLKWFMQINKPEETDLGRFYVAVIEMLYNYLNYMVREEKGI